MSLHLVEEPAVCIRCESAEVVEGTELCAACEQYFLVNQYVLLKYIADGAETVDDVVDILEGVALKLRTLQAEGYELTDAVDSGYVNLMPGGKS